MRREARRRLSPFYPRRAHHIGSCAYAALARVSHHRLRRPENRLRHGPRSVGAVVKHQPSPELTPRQAFALQASLTRQVSERYAAKPKLTPKLLKAHAVPRGEGFERKGNSGRDDCW